jgi:hypothetical protein
MMSSLPPSLLSKPKELREGEWSWRPLITTMQHLMTPAGQNTKQKKIDKRKQKSTKNPVVCVAHIIFVEGAFKTGHERNAFVSKR